MQTWLNFFILCFWISFISFLFNYYNMLIFIFFSEILWVFLYCITIFFACKNDDILNLFLAFLFLSLAGIEFCIILLLLIIFKKFNFSFLLNENDKNNKNLNNFLKKK